MSLPRRLRKRLGWTKWVLLDGGHKELRHKRRLRRLDRWATRELRRLPITPLPAASPIEVHMFCGHKQSTMGQWAVYGFQSLMDEPWSVYVHSDGSMTEDDARQWRERFPGVHVIGADEAEKLFARHCPREQYQHIHRFPEFNPFGHKLIDPHVAGDSPYILLLDSDVICYHRPDELLSHCQQAIDGSGAPYVSFRDPLVAKFAPTQVLTERFDGVAERFNTGVALIPRLRGQSLDELDQVIGVCEADWLKNYWAEQSLTGILAARWPHGYEYLSDRYQIFLGEDPVIGHYVSNLREHFYTDGIPAMLQRIAAMPA